VLKGREVVQALVEIRVSDFGLVGPRNNGTREYSLFLIALV